MFEVLLIAKDNGAIYSLCPVIPHNGTILPQKTYSKLMLNLARLRKRQNG